MRQSPALAGPGFPDWEAVDAAIGDGAEAAFEFLERLVASPSTVGRELPAQQIVAAELDRLGFEVSELSVPPETAAQAPAGVAQADYAGRPDVLGRLNPVARPRCCSTGTWTWSRPSPAGGPPIRSRRSGPAAGSPAAAPVT